MDEASAIRAIETLNAQIIELQTSKEYLAGVRKSNVRRFLSDMSPAGVKRALRELKAYLALSKAPHHPEQPNLTPEEWEASLRPGDPNKRVVVYTCVAGSYDVLRPPVYHADRISYVLFSNNEHLRDAEGWEFRPFPEEVKRLGANTLASRYLKSHPHELFAESFDASVYVDGNVQPISDLSYYVELIDPAVGFTMHRHRHRDTIAEEALACKAAGKGNAEAIDREVASYVAEGFPLDYGLLETNIVATDLTSDIAHKAFLAWWEAMDRAKGGRDQISLPYALWRCGIPLDPAASMGRNPYQDTKINIAGHRRS